MRKGYHSLFVESVDQLLYGHVYHVGGMCIVCLIALHEALCQQAIVHRDGCIEADAACGRVIQPLLAHIVGGYVVCDESTEARQYHAIVVAQQKFNMSSQISHINGKGNANREEKKIKLSFFYPEMPLVLKVVWQA